MSQEVIEGGREVMGPECVSLACHHTTRINSLIYYHHKYRLFAFDIVSYLSTACG